MSEIDRERERARERGEREETKVVCVWMTHFFLVATLPCSRQELVPAPLRRSLAAAGPSEHLVTVTITLWDTQCAHHAVREKMAVYIVLVHSPPYLLCIQSMSNSIVYVCT